MKLDYPACTHSSTPCQTDTLVESIIQSPALTAIHDAMKFKTHMTL